MRAGDVSKSGVARAWRRRGSDAQIFTAKVYSSKADGAAAVDDVIWGGDSSLVCSINSRPDVRCRFAGVVYWEIEVAREDLIVIPRIKLIMRVIHG